MRWIPDNLSIFFEGEEYFDTILIPCANIQFGEDKQQEITAIEQSIQKAYALDERLTGRILLLPPINFYGMVEDISPELDRVFKTFTSFSYIILLPSDRHLEEKLAEYIQAGQLQKKGLVIPLAHSVDDAFRMVLEKWQSK